MPSLRAFFSFFLTWWGAFLLGALDSSLLIFLPFGIDAVVIYLTASSPDLLWLYVLMTTAGSVCGAIGTYWIGDKVGEKGLKKLVSPRHLDRIRRKVRTGGAVALAVPALMPPPFPLTAVLLVCGALRVDWWRFVVIFALSRLARFGAEGLLARRFGAGILRVFESDAFAWVIGTFIVLVLAGTVVSGVVLWRRTRAPE